MKRSKVVFIISERLFCTSTDVSANSCTESEKSSDGSGLKAITTNLLYFIQLLGPEEREILAGSRSSSCLYAQACTFGFLLKKQIFSSTDAHFQY